MSTPHHINNDEPTLEDYLAFGASILAPFVALGWFVGFFG